MRTWEKWKMGGTCTAFGLPFGSSWVQAQAVLELRAPLEHEPCRVELFEEAHEGPLYGARFTSWRVAKIMLDACETPHDVANLLHEISVARRLNRVHT